MSYATIMVSVDALPGAAGRIRLAAQVADRFGASLTGAAARQLPLPVTRTSFEEREAIAAAESARLHEDLGALQAVFAREAGGPQRRSWRQAAMAATEHLVLRARGADLLVVGRPGPADGIAADAVRPDRVLMEAGRPVLVVPPGTEQLRAERVVLAWKDTPEARRAAAAALPFLRAAARVAVVSLGPAAAEEGADEVAELLARHGVEAAPAAEPVPEGLDEADGLLAFADRAGADLLVLGAYGRGRLREWVFGGVTRSVLQRSPLCCLMTH
ncbi:universal stress protein [Methylobacterium sp. WSM2598]|uniref:universal stress protein n=1 Tax=Methylobacterium sp. WSM2598 TaxID=398261 RepID=UPI00036D6760|nr:universal stress protein [Methylobacterium sp. WSM2598]